MGSGMAHEGMQVVLSIYQYKKEMHAYFDGAQHKLRRA